MSPLSVILAHLLLLSLVVSTLAWPFGGRFRLVGLFGTVEVPTYYLVSLAFNQQPDLARKVDLQLEVPICRVNE